MRDIRRGGEPSSGQVSVVSLSWVYVFVTGEKRSHRHHVVAGSHGIEHPGIYAMDAVSGDHDDDRERCHCERSGQLGRHRAVLYQLSPRPARAPGLTG